MQLVLRKCFKLYCLNISKLPKKTCGASISTSIFLTLHLHGFCTVRVPLVHMHHSVEESPEQHVCKEAAHEAPGKQQTSRFEGLVPPATGFENQEQGQQERSKDIKDETVESGQAEDARRGPGERGHGRAAVVEHSVVSSDGHLADELRSLAFDGYRGHVVMLKTRWLTKQERCETQIIVWSRIKHTLDWR